jgi:hypothetical protein
MTAIMTILAREATAGGGELTGGVGRPLTGFSLFQSLWYLQRHAAIRHSVSLLGRTTKINHDKESKLMNRITLDTGTTVAHFLAGCR